MKVALIKPPLIGHTVRGTGKYTEELYNALKKQNLDIDLVEYHSDLHSFDLVHYPYFDPFSLTLPLIKKRPTIVTVHDLIPLVFPQHFPKGVKGTIKWWIQRFSLERTSGIITDSKSSKNDIVKFTYVSEKKVNVIYLGVGKEFRQIKDITILSQTKNKYSLPDQFILYVGDRNYNKNIENLLQAFNKVFEKNKNIFLILVGIGLINLDTGPNIVKLGSIKTEELVHIYNLAKLYIQPSFAEGFGLPVLEAMACGCPTVVSDISSLREIMAPKSTRVNPFKIESIAVGIQEVLEYDTKTLQDVISDGLKQATSFSWEKCAEQTIQVYEKYIK